MCDASPGSGAARGGALAGVQRLPRLGGAPWWCADRVIEPPGPTAGGPSVPPQRNKARQRRDAGAR
jgi:hypothetical protein